MRLMRQQLSLVNLSNDFIAESAPAWVEHFEREKVPFDRLDEIYYSVLKTHTSNFAISSVEMVNKWHEIRLMEARQKASQQCPMCSASRRDKTIPHCPIHKNKS